MPLPEDPFWFLEKGAAFESGVDGDGILGVRMITDVNEELLGLYLLYQHDLLLDGGIVVEVGDKNKLAGNPFTEGNIVWLPVRVG